MAKRDYYEVLGVARGTGDAELKKVFRQLAMRWHPDRNPADASAEMRFKEINEAYEVLKDPHKRAAYDQLGHAAFENGGGGGGGRGGFDSFGDIFEDIFVDIMGTGGRRRSSATRGSDLRYNLTITLEEAFAGKKAQIRFTTSVGCEICAGSGADGGAEPIACPTCRGSCRVRTQQGFFSLERTCPTCQGAGRTIGNPCRACQGAGRVQREKTLAVTVPPGVEDGTRIRLSGEGEAGLRGGPAGDLYIFIAVAPHRLFRREGTQLFCRVPIPLATAALGGQVDVPTIEGRRAKITIPEGTQTGKQIRLRGKGVTELQQGSARGDMLVEVVVETPTNLTKRQQELLREFEKAGGDGKAHQPESEGFFARVKDLWDELTDRPAS